MSLEDALGLGQPAKHLLRQEEDQSLPPSAWPLQQQRLRLLRSRRRLQRSSSGSHWRPELSLAKPRLILLSLGVPQRTEEVKTGQVNPDRPLVGPSVDTFVGCVVGAFVGSPRGAEIGKSTLVGALVGALVGGLVGPLVGPLVGQSSLSPALYVVDWECPTTPDPNSANKGLPVPLGRGVCETKSKNGRSRPQNPFISRS